MKPMNLETNASLAAGNEIGNSIGNSIGTDIGADVGSDTGFDINDAAANQTANAGSAAVQRPIAVVTSMNVAAAPARVWKSLVFYEGIDHAPPLYLRLLLPSPIRTEGSKSAVGDEATCLYQGGHLLKRVTTIDENRLYEFTVVEQKLGIGAGVQLTGGSYALQDVGHGCTLLSITTRYTCGNRPRWLVQPVEEAVCHLFHRHLLTAIKTKAESETAAAA